MKVYERMIEFLPKFDIGKRILAKWKTYVHVDRCMFASGEVKQGERDEDKMKELVQKQLERWPKRGKEQNDRIDWLISSPLYKGNEDLESLRVKMLFYYFAYGFTPSEFLAYGLNDKTSAEREEFISDRESVKYAYRLNDYDSIRLFMDKRKTYEALKEFYHRDVIAITSEDDYAKFCEFVDKHPVFVKKDAMESCGRGIELVDINNLLGG